MAACWLLLHRGGDSALSLVVRSNLEDALLTATVTHLLRLGANPAAVGAGSEWNALHVAATTCKVPAVQALLANGRYPPSDQARALYIAASEGHLAAVAALLAAAAGAAGVPAIVNATSDKGWTATFIAAKMRHLAVVSALVAAGADVNVTTATGWTLP
jgi:ankyrin repeat protein